MKRFGLMLLFLSIMFAWLVLPPALRTQAAPNPPPGAGEVDPAIEQAVRDKYSSRQKSIEMLQQLDFQIDTVIPSQDENWALLWLAPVDRATGEIIATEPSLAIAHLTDAETDEWKIVIPSDSDWSNTLAQMPADLMPEQIEKIVEPKTIEAQASVQAIFRGYKLPWASGSQKRLSGSISHFLVYNSCSEAACRYAYDFADGSMFPLLAAKGGTVHTYKDTCANGSTTCTNYLVLKDESTIPTTWQIYYHLANGSIPSSLKKVGEPVVQGQYIGNVDDTGYSSGHHLHFHVTNYLYWYSNYYETVPWGWSVDIRFDDVSINDGVPRTCYEAAYYPGYGGTQCNEGNQFTSGNVGANPPTGSLSLPAAGTAVTGPGLQVAGSASDDLGVTKVQIIARGMDGIWRDVGSPLTTIPFSASVDLCSASVPNGPVDVALRIWDKEGNISPGAPGLRTLVKNYACAPPPPACTPTADKVVLYSEPNYQGACREYQKDPNEGVVITVPDLSSDSQVGADNTASIKVGSNVRVLLYTDPNYGGREEAFEVSDPNLADNYIGADTASSLKLQWKSAGISKPYGYVFPSADTDINPGPGDVSLSGTESLSVSMFASGATSFKLDLMRKEADRFVLVNSYTNLTHPVISLGSLPSGFYQAVGTAYNNHDTHSPGTIYFTVDNNTLAESVIKSVPYDDDLDVDTGEWQASGSWNHANLGDGRVGWQFNGYSNPERPVNYGSLTSPQVILPAEMPSYLHFSYRVDTESSYPYWDQRRVQISVEGAPFQDIQIVENGGAPSPQQKAPLWDDGQNYWLESPYVDLSAYAGKAIRVRFYFFTADTINNTGGGWQINHVRITNDPEDISSDESTRNDSLATATPVTLGQSITGQFIRPRGDVDFYQFNGTAGQRVAFRVEASAIGSNLDSYLFLLDSSGGLIVENDDIDTGVVRDSALSVVLPYTGVYYLKVKAWDHPQAGGTDQFYNLHLQSDTTPPQVNLNYPTNPWIPGAVFEVSANASDTGSGAAQVDFYWHKPDWTNGSWELIGSDKNGSDGWSMLYDLSAKGDFTNSGIYVEARDTAGNTSGVLLLGLKVDTTKPVSQLNALEGVNHSTAVRLTWTATDTGSGVAEVNFQYKWNGPDWQNLLPNPPVTPPETWFLGAFGRTYDFRMRARDWSNNLEDYPDNPEASTTIESTCVEDVFDASGDDSRDKATPLFLETTQEHNLCGLGDVDWVSFAGQAGVKLMVVGTSISGGAAVNLEIYNSAGELQASAQAAGLGKSAAFLWTPPETATYYLKATPLVEGLAGSNARYQLWIGQPKELYLPVIGR